MAVLLKLTTMKTKKVDAADGRNLVAGMVSSVGKTTGMSMMFDGLLLKQDDGFVTFFALFIYSLLCSLKNLVEKNELCLLWKEKTLSLKKKKNIREQEKHLVIVQ